jgi:hypothetical protein
MQYPRWVYHKEHAVDGVLVPRAEDEPKGEGWVSTPAAFDPNYVEPPPLPPEDLARGGRPFVAYPTWRYAAHEEPRLVASAEEDEQLDKAIWKDSPAAVSPTTTPHNATPPVLPPPASQFARVIPADRKAKDKE